MVDGCYTKFVCRDLKSTLRCALGIGNVKSLTVRESSEERKALRARNE